MHLLLFSGFVGSGKTTTVIRLAKATARSGRKVAVLVNEIGEIGIDNALMRRLGLNVWELVAGCICCTLSRDLVETLETLEADYGPDLVIIEASGAADPQRVLAMLPHYHGKPLSSTRTVTLVDPLRLPMLIEVLTPLMTSQIEHADIVIVSKADVAAQDEIKLSLKTIREINPRAQVIMRGIEAASETELTSRLLPWPI
jgi:G3E family GTPase